MPGPKPGGWPGRPSCPDPGPGLASPGRDQLTSGRPVSAVLGQIDGRATVQELAWRNGLALYGVMDWVARMIQDGLCTIARPPSARSAVLRPWVPPDPQMMRRVLAGLRRLD